VNHGEKIKILIVDDDGALLSFLAKKLEDGGFEVVQTHSGGGGLRLYQQHMPSEFVLTGYRFIPGPKTKDGVQLVAAIHGINPLHSGNQCCRFEWHGAAVSVVAILANALSA
jgi:response regulator RpfG family c-di-GMP phosphodiesterase